MYTTWARNLLRGGFPGGVPYPSGVLGNYLRYPFTWSQGPGRVDIYVRKPCQETFCRIHMVSELGFRRTVISGTLQFRKQHHELIFGNVLGETQTLTQTDSIAI